jgi:hypothetical protein
MKLPKHLPWLLAAFLVAAIIGFSLRYNPVQGAHPPALKTIITPIAAASNVNTKGHDSMSAQYAPDGSRIKEPSLEEVAARKRFQESKKKADESKERSVASLKKAAEKYTPEFIARVADSTMKRRDREYQKLFSSWNLNSQQMNEALDILRVREVKLLENRGNFFQDSSTANSAKKVVFDGQTEDLVSLEQLSLLLGESRATELVNTAKQLQNVELQVQMVRTGTTLPLRK